MPQVPTWREELLKRRDWAQLARQQSGGAFGDSAESRSVAQQQAAAMSAMLDAMAGLAADAEPSAPKPGSAAQAAAPVVVALEPKTVTVEAFRKAGGKWAKWAAFDAAVDAAKAPESVEIKGDDGYGVAGRRWRLRPLEDDTLLCIPSAGKLAVRVCGRAADAVVDLPTVSAEEAGSAEGPIPSSLDAAVPPGLWVTAGLLAKDGVALQLRLRRVATWQEASLDAGRWSLYRPAGGALTLANDFP